MKQVSRREWLLGGAALLSGCSASRPVPEPEPLPLGRSSFDMPGGRNRESSVITVHCYRPGTFTRHSPILLVIPGAGRNGDDYRDAWVGHADAAGILVASPNYPEDRYDPAAYHLGGTIQNLSLGEPLPGSTRNSRYLRDEDIRFDVNPRREEWLFNDFDRLFARVARATGSDQRRYDLFGHSAGGQILHRHAILWSSSRVRRIVAANSGFYTLPDPARPLPTGLAGLGVDDRALRRAFARDLTILLGEKDNDPDRGGTHLHTPMIDQQGRHRLARGQFFHRFASQRARELGVELRWDLRVVPGVGHDYRGMSAAAAALLYG
jgi:hypothetical protein